MRKMYSIVYNFTVKITSNNKNKIQSMDKKNGTKWIKFNFYIPQEGCKCKSVLAAELSCKYKLSGKTSSGAVVVL